VEHSALQHEHAPRPLPLFLELVREVAADYPELARNALKGLTIYAQSPRSIPPQHKPEIARVAGACLRDHGGDGSPVILVPSLINPPRILDLDEQVSLASAVANMGRRCLLLDWGAAETRRDLSIAGHVEQLLVPLIDRVGAPALIGYCLGGTMAVAAANLRAVERLATLASPWRFSLYPDAARTALQQLWAGASPASNALGIFPMEVLQASFWSLDPRRTVAKFAGLAALDPASAKAMRFAVLEDWANEGEPLPLPAARELVEDFFGKDTPGSGQWRVGGRAVSDHVDAPVLHLTAARDRIAPASSAPAGCQVELPAGHVGMVVGTARARLHAELATFLACR
jgi:polyhydroxyalkanoate synthase